MHMLQIGGLGRRRDFKRRQLGYPRYRSLLHVVGCMFMTFVKFCAVCSITDCPPKPAFDGGRLVQSRETPNSWRISFVALVMWVKRFESLSRGAYITASLHKVNPYFVAFQKSLTNPSHGLEDEPSLLRN